MTYCQATVATDSFKFIINFKYKSKHRSTSSENSCPFLIVLMSSWTAWTYFIWSRLLSL